MREHTCIVCGSATAYRWIPELGRGQCTCASCGCVTDRRDETEALYGTETLRSVVWARDAGACRYCGGAGDHLDHVVPVAAGGAAEIDNLVCACRPCGRRKRDRTPEQAGMSLRPILTQVRGYSLWAKQVDEAWYLVDENGKAEGGPYKSERAALLAAESMTDTRGT